MPDLILLEDDAVLREELCEFLMACGHRVDAVVSLAEFWQHYEPTRHQLAVIDLGLPDGAGPQLIQSLRHQRAPLAIVALTARNTPHERRQVLDCGANHLLTQHADLGELADALGALAMAAKPDTPSPRCNP